MASARLAPNASASDGSAGAASVRTTSAAAGSIEAEMGAHRLEVGSRDTGDGGGEGARQSAGRRADEAHELLDRCRVLGLDAVGVVRRVAEQRVGDLRLAGENGLGPRGLRDG